MRFRHDSKHSVVVFEKPRDSNDPDNSDELTSHRCNLAVLFNFVRIVHPDSIRGKTKMCTTLSRMHFPLRRQFMRTDFSARLRCVRFHSSP